MFGASPSEVTRMSAQARVDADVLFKQTGDPLDHLEMVFVDGMWTTQTLRNKQMTQQAYSQNKGKLEAVIPVVLFGAAGVGLIWWLSRRKR